MARVEINEAVFKTPGGASSTLQAASGVSVQVNVRGGAAATVYQAATGVSTHTNPLTTDSTGRIEGWLEPGSYDLVVSGTGITGYTQRFEAAAGASLVLIRRTNAGEATAQIQAAIEADQAFELGSGEHEVTGLTLDGAGEKLHGAGPGKTTIKVAAGSTHVIQVTGQGAEVSGLTIDQNRANTTAGHGIRAAGEDQVFRDLIIHDTSDYGIGIAESDTTFWKRGLIENVYIYNAENDGIDSKDTADANDSNRMSNVIVDSAGSDGTDQTGIDCRGPWQLENITVLGVTGDDAGIRFRPAGAADGTGFGCSGSSLTNFRVIGTAGQTGSVGVSCGSDDVSISGGYVQDTVFGVASTGDNNRVFAVTAKDCINAAGNDGEGFSAATGADYNTFLECIADGCWDGYVIDGAHCLVDDGAAINSGRYGIQPGTSTYLRIGGGMRFANNATNNILFSALASAATLDISTAPRIGPIPVIPVSGTTTITAITGLRAYETFVLRATSGWTLDSNAGAIRLAGGADFVATNHDTITLTSDGTNVWQVAAAVN